MTTVVLIHLYGPYLEIVLSFAVCNLLQKNFSMNELTVDFDFEKEVNS